LPDVLFRTSNRGILFCEKSRGKETDKVWAGDDRARVGIEKGQPIEASAIPILKQTDAGATGAAKRDICGSLRG
jgi:hypothetical protein